MPRRALVPVRERSDVDDMSEADWDWIIDINLRGAIRGVTAFLPALEAAGLRVSGVNPERGLAEIVELPGHPFFLAVQFHPEFRSRPDRPHPLFAGFVRAALGRAAAMPAAHG